jgi:hypothetical protein
MTIEFQAIEFETAHEAIQWTEASGRGVAILLDGPKVVEQADVDRLFPRASAAVFGEVGPMPPEPRARTRSARASTSRGEA